ncbi:hypothetical protein MBLNU457_6459t1 [Dothideomycetes sp. NU457]
MSSLRTVHRTNQLLSHLRALHDSAPTMSPTSTTPRPLRILMIHGYTQSGSLFRSKIRALEKHIEKAFPPSPKPGYHPSYPGGVSFSYPTGPIQLLPSQIPGFDVAAAQGDETDAWAWWRKRDEEPVVYEGMEKGIARVAEYLVSEGPFDGVVGFSQGGAFAGLIASLLETGRVEAFKKAEETGGMPFPESLLRTDERGEQVVVHPPLKFAVSYSGFGISDSPLYSAFYGPKIQTPVMHFLGSVDTVVSEERSLRLVEACAEGRGPEGCVSRVVTHPGGHFVPASNKQYAGALIAFIRESVDQGGSDKGKVSKEESVEDMDMPF